MGSNCAPVGFIAWSGVNLAFLGLCKKRVLKTSLRGGNLCIWAAQGSIAGSICRQGQPVCHSCCPPAEQPPSIRNLGVRSSLGARPAPGTGTTDEAESPPPAKRLPCCNGSQPGRSASDISGDISGISLLQGNVWHSSNQGLSWEIRGLDTQAATERPSISLRRGSFLNPPPLLRGDPLLFPHRSFALVMLCPFPFPKPLQPSPSRRASFLLPPHPHAGIVLVAGSVPPVPWGARDASSSCCCLGISVYICLSQRRP